VAWRSQKIDEFLLASLAGNATIHQAVLLGAGLDTRAWRLKLSPDFTLYELDASADAGIKSAKIPDGPLRLPRCSGHIPYAMAYTEIHNAKSGPSKAPTGRA
jgi:O-methyltransferase involved in polyketide biosynthesis